MFEHFIIMASSYSKGTRIALQYVYDGGVDGNEIQDVLNSIESAGEGQFTFSTHYVCTEYETWESVVSYDPFFEDAYLVDSLDEMIFLLKQDMEISGLDVAKLILAKRECTHLELEKLTYLCYADYLCEFDKRLCEDRIYAFTYGPVFKSVYDEYRRCKGTLEHGVSETIARSRILLLPDGRERISSIEKTLKRYEKCSSTDMVKITHENGSPWDMKDSTKKYQIIEDELILERHHIEDEYYERTFACRGK